MRPNLNLSQWASLAEIVGMFGVLVSLVFLVISIERNTSVARAESMQAIYGAIADIDLRVAADARWSEIIVQGRRPDHGLSEAELFRYDMYVTSMLDWWDLMQLRYEDRLWDDDALEGYDIWFSHWAAEHVTPETWARIGWSWQSDHGAAPKLRRAIGEE